MTLVHGWRLFNLKRCTSHDGEVILAGQYGKHVHNRIAGRARCRSNGKPTGFAMWQEENSNPLEDAHNLDNCPDLHCSCGYYFYRMYKGAQKDAGSTTQSVLAHITCIEETVLHTEGGRTSQYKIDYILTPDPDTKAYLTLIGNELNTHADYSDDFPFISYSGPQKTVNLAEEVGKIATNFGVPILDKDDLDGCQDCIRANEWRSEVEIDSFNDELRKYRKAVGLG